MLARPCAAHSRLFGFIATPNGALCAPPHHRSFTAHQKYKIDYFQKQNASLWPELGLPGAYIFPLG
jgi:hypothetical protein